MARRNPILEQEAPNMHASDLRMLLRNAIKSRDKAFDRYDLALDTIDILNEELERRGLL